ncbi:amidohydrolase [candidate division WOR-3 bacterium]|jgi:amidohydrolase|nr:amidohydrolase [candidate division WOR-3 bacterium]
MNKILRKALSIKNYIIEIRRELHKHPELAFEEKWTHKFISKELKALSLYPVNINKTGIIVDIGKGNNKIGLRADMDALPINEENELPFKSINNGVMHACGHDTHMAMLLGAAKLLTLNSVERPVRLLFQPSEERTPGGAKGMIEEGVLEGVSEIFGIHIDPEIEIGSLSIRSGVMMASPDEMDIKITGTGGHAAEPHKTNDVIYATSLFINEIQGLVSRKSEPTKPVVISICSIHGGSTYNIIPTNVRLKGTVRTIDKESWQNIPQWIDDILKGISLSYGIEYELLYKRGYPILKNDEKKTKKLICIAQEIFKNIEIMDDPVMGGEDFAYYLEKIPGSFSFIGGANKKKGIYSKLHTPHFIIDEDALPMGAALLYALANEKADN